MLTSLLVACSAGGGCQGWCPRAPVSAIVVLLVRVFAAVFFRWFGYVGSDPVIHRSFFLRPAQAHRPGPFLSCVFGARDLRSGQTRIRAGEVRWCLGWFGGSANMSYLDEPPCARPVGPESKYSHRAVVAACTNRCVHGRRSHWPARSSPARSRGALERGFPHQNAHCTLVAEASCGKACRLPDAVAGPYAKRSRSDTPLADMQRVSELRVRSVFPHYFIGLAIFSSGRLVWIQG